MAFNFPATPVDGDTVTQGGIRYIYQASRGVWTVDINDRFIPSEQLETLDTTIGGYTTVDYDVLDGDAIIASRSLQVGNIVPTADARPSSGEGLFVVGTDNAGATGTTAGDVVFGNSSEFVSWDASAALLTIQGEVTNIRSDYLSAEGPAGFRQVSPGTHDFTGLEEGLYAFVLVGGGGGGSAGGGSGGSAGGMAIWSMNYDGVTSLNVTVGNGGSGGVDNDNLNGANGTAGGQSTFNLGGTTIATANGGGGGIFSNNNNAKGGTAVVNLDPANNANVFFRAANTNSVKGSSNSNGTGRSAGGAGVVIPTVEAFDANATGAVSANSDRVVYSGGSMYYNVTSANTLNANNSTTTSVPTFFTGAASFPTIIGDYGGIPGTGSGGNNTANSGGSGGIFAGGGGSRSNTGSSDQGGNGGVGAGGGAATNSSGDGSVRVAGSGGTGALYFRRL